MPRAIQIAAFGGPEQLKLVDVAVGDPGPGEIRIRHHACGLNFIDVYQRTGLYANPLPLNLGMEGAGIVEAVGAGVTHLHVGDRAAYAINYSTEDFAARVKEITGGKGVKVVYDSVGKDTWEGSLSCLRPFGLMASFGNASGPVAPFAPGILGAKGSLYVTRQTLFTHIATRETNQVMADELFAVVQSGAVKIRIDQRYPLAEAAQAHRDLEARKTTGCSILLP
jgi:NADPH2:quinone reductase